MHPAALIERFERHVDRSGGPEACWPWTGQLKQTARPSCRYGVLCVGARRLKVKAHRIALELSLGRLLGRDEVARHIVCDNPVCCNPLHLAPGPQLANIADQVRARRFARARVALGMTRAAAVRLSRQIRLLVRRVCAGQLPLGRARELVDAATLCAFPRSLVFATGGVL